MNVDDLANVRMHTVTLSFYGDLEDDFLKYFNQNTIKQIRFAFLISVLLDWLYVAFDDQLLPTVKQIEEFFTYNVYFPYVLSALLLTFYRSVRSYIQTISSVAMVVRSIGTIWLMTADASAAKYIYTGLLLVITFGFSVLRLRFIFFTAASLFILISYVYFMVLPYSDTALYPSLVNNGVSIALFIILGMIATYSMERYARTVYIQNQIIDNERLKASEALVALEKERVSREIHDGISSEFTGILAFTEKIKSNLDQKNHDQIITHIENSARRGIQELRNIMMALGSDAMTLDYFTAYIRRHVCDMLTSQGVEVEFEVKLTAKDTELSPQVVLALFRITQEACHNILKHSKADKTKFSILSGHEWLELELFDNGQGFSEENVVSGNGITNMRKRAERAGGLFSIITSCGKGATILVRIPLT